MRTPSVGGTKKSRCIINGRFISKGFGACVEKRVHHNGLMNPKHIYTVDLLLSSRDHTECHGK